MGLDTTHDCFHGGYHTFNVWRNKVAEAAGYEIVVIDGHPAPKIDWDSFTEDNLEGKWNVEPEDVLFVLFVHFDCDGYILHKHTKKMADRLREILPKLEGVKDGYGDHKERTETFIKGLLLAHKRKQKVVFS